MTCDPNNAAVYLSKFTILYGTSGAGKTTVIRHIIAMLSPHLRIVHIFSGSDDSGNSNFADISPADIISSEITPDRLTSIFTKQVPHAKRYAEINDMDIMKGLAKLIATPAQLTKLKGISGKFKALPDEPAAIKSNARSMLLRYYHSIILEADLSVLPGDMADKISTTRELIRRYAKPPCIALIIDDCSDRRGDWAKSAIIKTLAYKARHYHITTILADQGQSLETDVRVGAHNHIFMNADSLRRTFSLTASGLRLSKSESALVERLFAEAAAIGSVSNRQTFATVARCKFGANVQYGLIKYAASTAFDKWVLSAPLCGLFQRPDKKKTLLQFLERVAKK